MTCFFDTSAIVKLFIDEHDHEVVRTFTNGPIVVADIALVEFPSAMYRKQRMGELSARSAQLLSRAFAGAARGQAPRLDLHVVSTELIVLQASARLVARHPLRAYDAVQLGTAVATEASLPGCTFGSFDERLNEAALAEGLRLAW